MQSEGALFEPVLNVLAFNIGLHSGIGHDQIPVEEPGNVRQWIGGADCLHSDWFTLHYALGFQWSFEDRLAEFVYS